MLASEKSIMAPEGNKSIVLYLWIKEYGIIFCCCAVELYSYEPPLGNFPFCTGLQRVVQNSELDVEFFSQNAYVHFKISNMLSKGNDI